MYRWRGLWLGSTCVYEGKLPGACEHRLWKTCKGMYGGQDFKQRASGKHDCSMASRRPLGRMIET